MRVKSILRRRSALGQYWEYHCVLVPGDEWGPSFGVLRRLVVIFEQLAQLMEVSADGN